MTNMVVPFRFELGSRSRNLPVSLGRRVSFAGVRNRISGPGQTDHVGAKLGAFKWFVGESVSKGGRTGSPEEGRFAHVTGIQPVDNSNSPHPVRELARAP